MDETPLGQAAMRIFPSENGIDECFIVGGDDESFVRGGRAGRYFGRAAMTNVSLEDNNDEYFVGSAVMRVL